MELCHISCLCVTILGLDMMADCCVGHRTVYPILSCLACPVFKDADIYSHGTAISHKVPS